jgi:U3 small nucleolar RNA-associated protein 10
LLAYTIQATAEYFDALKLVVNEQSKSVVVKNSPAIFELLLKAFDHRRLVATSDEEQYISEAIDRIESIYNDVAISVILKLNDATFRPFFVRLVEWVTLLPAKDIRGRALRATVLYKSLTVLFGRLKVRFYHLCAATLLTSYISHWSRAIQATYLNFQQQF